jgi:hypothetical protein
LKNTNKIINFFSTHYYDNIKYNNYTATLLKIFFERANKVTSNISTLGNVYRNSKWSDLKIQNIKTLHLRSFISLLLFIALAVFLAIFLLRLDGSVYSTTLVYVSWFWSYITDLISYSLAALLLLFYSLYAWTLSRLALLAPSIFSPEREEPWVNVELSQPTRVLSTDSQLGLSSDHLTHANNHTEIIAHHVFKSKLFLDAHSHGNSLSFVSHLTGTFNTTPVSIFLGSSSSSYLIPRFDFSLVSLESSLSSTLDSLIEDSPSKVSISQGALSSLHSNFELFTHVYSSIETSMSLAKQYRWLIKNSPVSEGMSISNYAFTQSKSLIDNSTLNSSLSTVNVWASSHGSHLNTLNTYKDSRSPSVGSHSLLSGINFFEESRNFLLKKSYYALQPQYTTSRLSHNYESTAAISQHLSPNHVVESSLTSDASLLLTSQTLTGVYTLQQGMSSPNFPSSLYFNSNEHLSYYKSSFNNFLIDLNTTNTPLKSSTLFYGFSTVTTTDASAKLKFKL